MWKFNLLVSFLLLCSAALAAAQGSRNKTRLWQTLSGNAPLVVARGGFSGIFPDSSILAYSLISMTSLPNAIAWCDVQLTKDGAGICFPDLKLENASDIEGLFANRKSTYLVNGSPVSGYYSVDFTLDELRNVILEQGVYSRPNRFDLSGLQILTVEDVAKEIRPPGYWLNVQHDAFFSQHNLSMRSYIISASRSVVVNYISSPEVNFLRSIIARFQRSTTKLVFRFLGQNDVEPSINQTYGSLTRNLTFIKTFASGILVPKSYIWPVDDSLYLLPHTSIVLDAHKVGLEVFASEFANDVTFAYNYSYDPVSEYISFIDNGNFSVDGVLSDFPITPSAAIGCFSHMGKNDSDKAKLLVISNEGASGDYPGCTDLAYEKAISDGVDVLDCPVQMTKDGIPICLGSVNLLDRTNVAQTSFSNLTRPIPELIHGDGIFTFSLNWSQIKNLTPAISNPWTIYRLYRNPKFKNAGKLLTLSDFLDLANNATSLSGILIRIENATYLADKQGLGVTDAVLDVLSKAGPNNQTAKKIMIQSTSSSVLMKFKEKSNYELVYEVDEIIRDVTNSTILDIQQFASSVALVKKSIYPLSDAYITSVTNIIPKFQAFKLPVYVKVFNNEFVSQAWDFFADAYVEMNTFTTSNGIDGVITEFPLSAIKYRKNRCLGLGDNTPPYMNPIQAGSLMQAIPGPVQPPALPPSPVLVDSDVVEPPLPPVRPLAPPPRPTNGSAGPGSSPPSHQPKTVACVFVLNLALVLATMILF